MVENFTQEQVQGSEAILEQRMMDGDFEAKLKEGMKSLLTEPRQSVIDTILQYSKSHPGT